MTVYTLTAPMPETLAVGGMILKLEAVSPTTGAAITGVTCSSWTIYGDDVSDLVDTSEPNVAGPFMLVPGPDSAIG